LRGLVTRHRAADGSGVFPRLAETVHPGGAAPASPAAAPPARAGRTRRARGARLWRPVVAGLAVVGLGVGAFVAYVAHRGDEARVRAAIDAEAAACARSIEGEVAALVEGVHTVRALSAPSPELFAAAFDAWAREAAARHPAFRSVAWVAVEQGALRVDRTSPRTATLCVGDVVRDDALLGAVDASLGSGSAVLSVASTTDGARRAGTFLALAVAHPDARAGARPTLRGTFAVELSFDGLLERLAVGEAGHDLALTLSDDESGQVVGGTSGAGALHAAQPARALGRAFTLRADADPSAFEGLRGTSPFVLGALAMLLWELGNAALVGLARSWRSHALDRQAQVVHAAFEGLGEAVILTDRAGAVVLANQAATCLLGPGVRGTDARARVLDPALGRATDADDDPVARALDGTPTAPVERRLAIAGAADGTWVESAVRPLRDTTGAIEGALVVIRDVTARREALETARRMHERDLEMALAQRVQRHLYPGRCPAVPGLDLAGLVVPAAATCGDYYDVLVRADGSVLLAVGDVSGHGLGPALVMAEVRTLVRAMVEAGLPPVEVLRRIDAVLTRQYDGELFVTLLLVGVTPWTRELTYANAGHVPGLVVDVRGGETVRMGATGPPLGLGQARLYHTRSAGTLADGNVLAIVTDGATESPGPDDEPFEEERVIDVVRRRADASAEHIVTELRDAIHAYSNGRCSRDDVTLVVAKAVGP